MKMCAKCGGTMKNGGKVTAVKKMAKGGQAIVGMPGYNATLYPTSFKKGGAAKSKFGMLSVKAGIDNNPKPTAADRIAGATKKIKRVRKTKK
jgi:hypothetical protein